MPEAAQTHDDAIAIVVLTYNRLHLFEKCVANVLAPTSPSTTEIVIWDNGCTDGTPEFLESLADPRIRVVRSPKNIGHNAYAEAVKFTTAPFIVELDDDVTDAPEGWDKTLRDSLGRLPDVGFLAADLEDDPNDVASRIRHHVRPHEYKPVERLGVNLLEGPPGGGCAMTSREIYDLVGGFAQQKGKIFYMEDAAYIDRVQRHGFRAFVLRDLRVHHTGGEYYGALTPAQLKFWARFESAKARRETVKRLLVRVPFLRRLNERRGWFVAPG